VVPRKKSTAKRFTVTKFTGEAYGDEIHREEAYGEVIHRNAVVVPFKKNTSTRRGRACAAYWFTCWYYMLV